MKIEVAVTTYEMVEIDVALNHMIPWAYHIMTGNWVEKHYLGEKDDVIMEVSQESIGTDNSICHTPLFYLECTDLPQDAKRHTVKEYIFKNKDRAIDYQKIWKYM